MESKDKRIYEKAMKYCEKGKMDKALELCEKGIANNLSASELLNLKGLLLYEKGMLKEAITIWKLNISVNSDIAAKTYVRGSEADKKKLNIYREAEKYYREGNVDKALELCLKCVESDFNCIKVNTMISACYEKKGYYYKSIEYIEKVLKVNSNYEQAKKIKERLLVRLKDDYNQDYTSKSKLIIVTVAIIIVAICAGGYSIKNKMMGNDDKNLAQDIVNDNQEQENTEKDIEIAEGTVENNIVENSIEENNENPDSKFDYKNVTIFVENKNFDEIFDMLSNVKADNLDKEDLELYNKSLDLMKNEGVEYYYKTGLESYNNANYEDAEINLNKAYEYCEESYLKPHVIFYRGTVTSNLNKKDITEEMYEKYTNEYPDGSYIEGVLYDLALLNQKNGDLDNAKKYAQKLKDKFPESIYINSKLDEITN